MNVAQAIAHADDTNNHWRLVINNIDAPFGRLPRERAEQFVNRVRAAARLSAVYAHAVGLIYAQVLGIPIRERDRLIAAAVAAVPDPEEEEPEGESDTELPDLI